MAQHLRILTTAALWLAGAGLAPAQPATPAASNTPAAANRSASLRLRMLAEEDARSTTPTALLQGLKGDDAGLRRVALRALGRFQSPELAAAIVPSLRDPAPPVRMEAANALAQSVFASTRPEEVREAARQLRARLVVEADSRVRGALALSIGRLRYPSDDAGREAAAIVLDVAFPKGPGGVRAAAAPAALADSLRGLYHAALARPLPGTVTRQPGAAPVTWLSDEARETLGSFLMPRLDCCLAPARAGSGQCAECDANRPDPTGPDAQFRRQAMQALAATRQPDALVGLALVRDADEQTRALALRWALEASWMDEPRLGALVTRWGQRFGMSPDAARAEVLARAQLAGRLVREGPSAIVRYEGVRTLTPEALKKRGCAPVLAAMDDPSIAVAGYAMENAHLACSADPAVRQRLEELSRDLPAAEASVARRAGGPMTGAPSAQDMAANAATRAGPAGTAPRGWHRFAFALQGYARVDPAAARDRVVAAMQSAAAPVRRHGAVAAGHVLGGTRANATRDLDLIAAVAALVDDQDPNVATEAVRALAAHDRTGSRDVFLRALRRDFHELILEAAQALRPARDGRVMAGPNPVPPVAPRGNTGGSGSVPGTPGSMASVEMAGSGTPVTAAGAPDDAHAVSAALDALDRLTRAKRETSRDPRRALVQLIGDEGREADAVRIQSWLRDFDPEIATEAARAVTAIRARVGAQSLGATGTSATASPAPPPRPDPQPLPRLPLPTDADLARMATARVVLTIGGRGPVVVRLRPDEAPLNAFRFLRLAEQGYYTGLTFHRIAPNFVVQGGSPEANEYSGDGPFSRDEVGLLRNARGTIGLSTRGRDTGDAQFYANLVDNTRLDHDYTVFGQVESGMNVVDALVEGDAIEKVEILVRPTVSPRDSGRKYL